MADGWGGGWNEGGNTPMNQLGDGGQGLTFTNASMGLPDAGGPGPGYAQPAAWQGQDTGITPTNYGVSPTQAIGNTATPMLEQMNRQTALQDMQNLAYQSGRSAQDLAGRTLATAGSWAQAQDPFAANRVMFGQKMMDLMKNPSGLTQTPGWQAGLEAIQRTMGAQGYQGSGNMMAELSKYGGDFFRNYMSMLGGFAGAGQAPGAGAGTMMQGLRDAASLIGQGQASQAYGASLPMRF